MGGVGKQSAQLEGENLAEARFKALDWGIGKSPSQKGRKPDSWSKFRKRRNLENTAVCDHSISHSKWILGLFKKRLLPLLEGIWRVYLSSPKTKGQLGSH